MSDATQAELDYVHQAITTGTLYNVAENGVAAAALGPFLSGERTLANGATKPLTTETTVISNGADNIAMGLRKQTH